MKRRTKPRAVTSIIITFAIVLVFLTAVAGTSSPTPEPSREPTADPSPRPTKLPTAGPTPRPTPEPTVRPTKLPTAGPTARPSSEPTIRPTKLPTAGPTARPTPEPTVRPTKLPTAGPTARPTPVPTVRPTKLPTAGPSARPTPSPTVRPTKLPTDKPTAKPTPEPTVRPTKLPTSGPTARPTPTPTVRPTKLPTAGPTARPTPTPTVRPTKLPTAGPTARPTPQPTVRPTKLPTAGPTARPTPQPTVRPTKLPTAGPTARPTPQPTVRPTKLPTAGPTARPSADPTVQPSEEPTAGPTPEPSAEPTAGPSASPSADPTEPPSASPTAEDTSFPTSQPSTQPSSAPSTTPTRVPSGQPSREPTTFFRPSPLPSSRPSAQPVALPSCQPSSQPSGAPSRQPSGSPSSAPSAVPTTESETFLLLSVTQIVENASAASIRNDSTAQQVFVQAVAENVSGLDVSDIQIVNITDVINSTSGTSTSSSVSNFNTILNDGMISNNNHNNDRATGITATSLLAAISEFLSATRGGASSDTDILPIDMKKGVENEENREIRLENKLDLGVHNAGVVGLAIGSSHSAEQQSIESNTDAVPQTTTTAAVVLPAPDSVDPDSAESILPVGFLVGFPGLLDRPTVAHNALPLTHSAAATTSSSMMLRAKELVVDKRESANNQAAQAISQRRHLRVRNLDAGFDIFSLASFFSYFLCASVFSPSLQSVRVLQESIAIGSTTEIVYEISVKIQDLGFFDPDLATDSITQDLSSAATSGALTSSLQRLSQQENTTAMLSAATNSAPAVRRVSTQIVRTFQPSFQPTILPANANGGGGDDDSAFYSGWPIYGQALFPIGVLLFIALVVFGVVHHFRLHHKYTSSAEAVGRRDRYATTAGAGAAAGGRGRAGEDETGSAAAERRGSDRSTGSAATAAPAGVARGARGGVDLDSTAAAYPGGSSVAGAFSYESPLPSSRRRRAGSAGSAGSGRAGAVAGAGVLGGVAGETARETDVHFTLTDADPTIHRLPEEATASSGVRGTKRSPKSRRTSELGVEMLGTEIGSGEPRLLESDPSAGEGVGEEEEAGAGTGAAGASGLRRTATESSMRTDGSESMPPTCVIQ